MSVLYLTMTISGIMGLIFLIFFIWSVKTGQFDEYESNAITILNDDDSIKRKEDE